MFQTVKQLLEKGTIDEKINTIKGKFQAALKTSLSSSSSNSLGSVGAGKERERKYILTFTQLSPLGICPPPLPLIQVNPNLFKRILTEYADVPFSFYFEEIQEPFPVIQLQIQEQLPLLTEGEPSDGLHHYDFNIQEYNRKRQDHSVVQDIRPHFLRGFQEPIQTFSLTPAHLKALTLTDLYSSAMSLSHLSYVCIQNVQLKGKTKKQLFRTLVQTPMLETLILKSLNIGSIQKAHLPKLRFCDLSNNKIRSLHSMRKLINSSPNMEVLDLTGNPLAMKEEEIYIYRLLGKLPQLEILNKKTVTIENRLKSLSGHKRAILEQIRWELHLDQLAEIRQLRPIETGWRPQNIQQINLPNQQLGFFYVGNMPNLRSLDLSGNLLTDISSAGLEKCDHLLFVNFRNNQLISTADHTPLSVIALMPSLQCIKLDGNPRCQNYRSKLIYLGRNSKGTNRSTGLIQIDSQVVTREEKIAAIELYEPGQVDSAASYLWKLLLIERFGHKQLQTIPDFLAYVKSLELARCNVMRADLSVFHQLEVLDLSQNKLTHLQGLSSLVRLRVLNLFDNPDLLTGPVISQMVALESLESFIFHVSNPTHQRNGSKDYRRSVLAGILLKNRNLSLLDNNVISFDERVQSYLDNNFPIEIVEKYRFFLALTVNCTLPFNRGLYPDQVEIGSQYDPLVITSLLRLRSWSLTSPAMNLRVFENVQEIDLSNNRLTDCLNIGLQSLVNLTKLSLINNQLANPILLIAQLLDGMQSLEIIALRGNPIMMKPEHRLSLIGHMSTMKQLDHTLKVIDTEITIYDKVEGWKLSGGSITEAESFKLSYICMIRDLNIYDYQIQNLELSDCALEYLDVTNLVNLKTLLLPNNRFRQMQSIKSLHALHDLFALDLRYNQFEQMLDMALGIQPLLSLRVLGIYGNPFPKSSITYRIQFLSLVPGLFKQHQHPLSILDSQEIHPEELVESSLLVQTCPCQDKREYLFHISMLRKAPTVPFEMLTELDLSNCKISILVLRSLTKLVVLSLSDNLITDSTLRDSGINNLQELKALDIRNNHLKDLSNLCKIVDLLNIESLFVEENSCFDKDNQKSRIKFFKKCSNSKVITTLKYLNGNQVTSVDTEKLEIPVISIIQVEPKDDSKLNFDEEFYMDHVFDSQYEEVVKSEPKLNYSIDNNEHLKTKYTSPNVQTENHQDENNTSESTTTEQLSINCTNKKLSRRQIKNKVFFEKQKLDKQKRILKKSLKEQG
ncbi:hypothetical protein DLAC_00438 [Tieghemostelium lacteum]|uniref:Uncharacterized protein n=1 Tax=Tieghemostelium lacteum TaxID=361077 RepID=A0A152A9Z2_TIELA|nr:hypothetical protein DLAC_00438 [Tieghemostelium lacteum]|eukprot:KYR02955.1 hypothetical protein DLAC_00438 [Tieghemostelium lacteum]